MWDVSNRKATYASINSESNFDEDYSKFYSNNMVHQQDFYSKQLDKVYTSGIEINGLDAENIKMSLDRKIIYETIDRIKLDKKLQTIKSSQNIQAVIYASKVSDDINSHKEVFQYSEVNQFLVEKQKKQMESHINLIKKHKEYHYNKSHLNFKSEHGKQMEIIADSADQKYLVCKFEDKNRGQNLRVFQLDVKSGFIGKEILREKLFEQVNSITKIVPIITYDDNKINYAINTDNESIVDTEFDQLFSNQEQAVSDIQNSTFLQSETDTTLQNASSYMQVNQDRSIRSTQAKLSRASSWLSQGTTAVGYSYLYNFDEEQQQYKVFNKTYIQFKNYIYFYKVQNNYEQKEITFKFMKLDLIKETILEIRTEVIKGEQILVDKQPFWIECVSFCQQHENMKANIDTLQFQDKIFLLLVGNGNKTVSLRKANDISINLYNYSAEDPLTWVLVMDNLFQSKLQSTFNYIIGGLELCKIYNTFVQGKLYHRANSMQWDINTERINLQDQKNLQERFQCINHQVYTSSKQSQNLDQQLQQKSILDNSHNLKIEFFSKYFNEEDQILSFQKDKMKKEEFQKYLKDKFHYDNFMILQDFIQNKTYVFSSEFLTPYIKIYQLKTNVQSMICQTHQKIDHHPLTTFMLQNGQILQSHNQFHPKFIDIASNGFELVNNHGSKSKKISLNDSEHWKNKPSYYESFVEEEETKFHDQRPSKIFKQSNDDRAFVPRLQLRNQGSNVITELLFFKVDTQEKVEDKKFEVIVSVHEAYDNINRNVCINTKEALFWKKLDISDRWSRTELQPSSNIECVNKIDKIYKQNWQICIVSYLKQIVQIFEYQVCWQDDVDSIQDQYQCGINYIAKTLIVLKEPLNISYKVQFLPYCEDNESLLISGTQIIHEKDFNNSKRYLILNLPQSEIQFKTNLSNCGYKIFQNGCRKMDGFMVYSRINSYAQTLLLDSQIDTIFQLQLRVLTNMIPNMKSDIDYFVETVVNPDAIRDDEFKIGDLFAPMEILNCQNMIDYLTLSPNILGKIINDRAREKAISFTLIGQLFIQINEPKAIEQLKNQLPDLFVQSYLEVSDDLFYNNTIFRCFDNISTRQKSCQALIDLSVQAKMSSWVYNRLMQIFPLVVRKSYFENYGQFFTDYDGNALNTTFAMKLIDLELPDYCSKKELLEPLFLKEDEQSSISHQAKKQVIQNYNLDFSQKQNPNKHYVLDFRSLLLTNHIRSFLLDSKRGNKELIYESISIYDIYYLIYKATKMFGDDIEKYDTMRAMIDYQYYMVTAPYFKKQLFSFVFFFLVPYLVQLFLSTQLTLIYICLGVCQINQFFLLSQLLSYWKVVGVQKFFLNTLNRCDAFLIFFYSLFTVRRIVVIGKQMLNPENKSDGYMPNKLNTIDPDYILGLGIAQNFLISFNCAVKLMLMLENIEGYGLLITQLKSAILASSPFLVFSFVWLCVFCVLYKMLGNQASEYHGGNNTDFPWIHPFFQYFLYSFENFVGNTMDLEYSIWQNMLKQKQITTYNWILAQGAIYALYGVWWANQYFMFVILLNFLIAVISDSYDDIIEEKKAIEYKQKAELNRQTLIWNKAWYNLDKVNCFILSANTEDKTLCDKWNKIIEDVQNLLNSSEKEVQTYVDANQIKNAELLSQVKTEIRQQVKDQYEIASSKIKQLDEIYHRKVSKTTEKQLNEELNSKIEYQEPVVIEAVPNKTRKPNVPTKTFKPQVGPTKTKKGFFGKKK